jgi:hypothetical protein
MGEGPRRRYSWTRSRSESFGPIRQVGVAASIGMPMLVVGGIMVVLLIVYAGTTALWIIAGTVFVLGVIFAASGRIL